MLGFFELEGAEKLISDTKTELDEILQIYDSADLNSVTMNELYERIKNEPFPELSEEEQEYFEGVRISTIRATAFLDKKDGSKLIEIELSEQ